MKRSKVGKVNRNPRCIQSFSILFTFGILVSVIWIVLSVAWVLVVQLMKGEEMEEELNPKTHMTQLLASLQKVLKDMAGQKVND